MLISRRNITVVAIGFAILVTIANAYITFQSLQRVIRNEQLVSHTLVVLNTLRGVVNGLQDTEVSQRGYLLTGSQVYLDNYASAKQGVMRTIDAVQAATGDNPAQQARIGLLRIDVQARIASLEVGISKYNEGGTALAAEYVAAGIGRKLFEKVQADIAQIASTEESLLNARQLQSNGDALRLDWTIALALLGNLLMLSLIAYLTRRELSTRDELQRRKDDFIRMASHELKTPVTSMRLYAQSLQRSRVKAGDDDSAGKLQNIIGQLDRMTYLINDLLDISRIESNELTLDIAPFDVHELVEQTIIIAQFTSTKHRITLTGNVKKPVKGDRYRLSQVILNLLVNAIKYSPDHDEIEVKLDENKQSVHIHIIDRGIGIPKNQQALIFDRYHRVEHKRQSSIAGLGLGLYIASQIVKLHHGHISVTSNDAGGSIFTVTLPKRRQDETQSTRSRR